MAKDTFYFTHDYGARNDPKLQNLLMQMGQEGKGIYWDLIELLYEQGGYLDLKNLEIIAFSLRTKPELLEKVVKSFDLFEIKRNLFFSKAVLARLKIKQEKSETARRSIEKRWKKNGNTEVIRTNKDDDTNVILERKVVKGKERKEKKVVKVVKGKESMREKPNGKTDFTFGEKTGTEHGKDTENKQDNEGTMEEWKGQETAKAFKCAKTAGISDKMVDDISLVQTSESPPKSNCSGLDIISDTSVDTFNARVEYAKSLGIEDSVAKRLCNFAQSKKFPLFKMHYESFIGKSDKEVGETFVLLNLLVLQKTKKTSGLKQIWTG